MAQAVTAEMGGASRGPEQAGRLPPSPIRREIWSIQYLRAVAAIAVVVFHCTQGAPMLNGLQHGVDLFFVISGFIMVAVTQGRDIGVSRFLLDRIVRIVPPYWLATLLTFALFRAGIAIFGASGSAALMGRSLFFVPTFDEAGRLWPTLYLGWTLNYEMFFYVVFAITLCVRGRLRLPLLLGVLLAAVATGRWLSPRTALAITYTSPLMLEFLAGACLGALFGMDLERRSPARQIGLSLVLLAAFLGLAGRSSVGLYGGLALTTVTVALIAERYGLVPRWRFLRALGNASFAIYLFQQITFTVVEHAWRGLDERAGYHVRGHSIPAIAFAVAAGWLVYRFVERPINTEMRAVLERVTGERIALR